MKPFYKKYTCITNKKLVILMALGFSLLYSCKNDIETIQALTNELDLPAFSVYTIELSYTDSGRLKGKIIAPEVSQYVHTDDPYYEFPKGMKAIFYNKAGNPESYIQANYAIYYNNKQLWEARNKVLARNPAEGKKLETEQLFWNQKEKFIYSDKFTKVTNSDGIFIGENGFEAEEDLSKLKLKGYSGTATIRDKQPVEEPNP